MRLASLPAAWRDRVHEARDWPGANEIERVQAFPAPANCRKLLHRWRDRQRQPDVEEL